MKKIISGIQQVGIGVPDVYEAFDWYKKNFGMSVPLFDDKGTAALMLPYTNNQPQNRHAVLALNLKGGGGFEIWQYTTRTPLAPAFKVELGDLGIFICKIKSDDVQATYRELKDAKIELLNEPQKAPDGSLHFYLKDSYGNLFDVIENIPFFSRGTHRTGGAAGIGIGVSDMAASMKFYSEVLGYDKLLYDKTGIFEDLVSLEGGGKSFRRVLLTHSKPMKGPFSRILGSSQIELFEAQDYNARRIYADRQWGDLGFIHICFDIRNMASMKTDCESRGYPFRVDSGNNDFDMGEAAGHFAYVEDPDGTLIELVETFKIPIIKKFGWYLNLKKRNPEKALPDWLLKLLKYAG
ncbi:MAG: VOC family protein [Bacteroidales bacterium]|nr:VOC family protein [Bacteroidales bacterium]